MTVNISLSVISRKYVRSELYRKISAVSKNVPVILSSKAPVILSVHTCTKMLNYHCCFRPLLLLHLLFLLLHATLMEHLRPAGCSSCSSHLTLECELTSKAHLCSMLIPDMGGAYCPYFAFISFQFLRSFRCPTDMRQTEQNHRKPQGAVWLSLSDP